VPDPARASAVTQIFTWRATEHLSYQKIAERLNLDIDRYPPPQPVLGRGRRAVGRWTGGAVREILCNPKYTGYMVYNRSKRSRPERNVAGRVNPPAEWVWSSKPTHEPLTTRRLFEAGTVIGRSNRGSRQSPGPNRHPATRRTFRLRSYVFCELCGRRLCGKTRRVGDVYNYYACEPNPAHHAHRDWYPTHPKSLWVREDKLLTLLDAFFANRIFGPDRRALLDQGQAVPSDRDDPTVAQRAALETKIKELGRQQTNVINELQTYHSTGTTTSTSSGEPSCGPPSPTSPLDPTLLDQLPVVELDLAALPEDLQRQLFDAFQLQIWYHHRSRRVGLRVTINADTDRRLTAFIGGLRDQNRPQPPATDTLSRPTATTAVREDFSLALCAPGGIRTHTEWILSPSTLPLVYRGSDPNQPTHYAKTCGTRRRGVERGGKE
jgi:site-specific DNA recombinase